MHTPGPAYASARALPVKGHRLRSSHLRLIPRFPALLSVWIGLEERGLTSATAALLAVCFEGLVRKIQFAKLWQNKFIICFKCLFIITLRSSTNGSSNTSHSRAGSHCRSLTCDLTLVFVSFLLSPSISPAQSTACFFFFFFIRWRSRQAGLGCSDE